MPDLLPLIAHMGAATIIATLITWALAMGAAITISYLCHRRTP